MENEKEVDITENDTVESAVTESEATENDIIENDTTENIVESDGELASSEPVAAEQPEKASLEEAAPEKAFDANAEIAEFIDRAEAAEEAKKPTVKSEIFAWIRDIAIAIIVALLISQVVSPTIVQEHSMDDTLNNNDYLFVYKLAYKFGNTPKYGDIVVFQSGIPGGPHGKDKLLIKRVVAVGGDTVAVMNDHVYRNGQELVELYTKDGVTNGYMEETVVPEGKLFLLGDNRLVSIDSRSADVGFVDESLLKGKAVIRLFPFNKIGGLYGNYVDLYGNYVEE